jgi:ABC-type Fe3+-hydroxamate transport system substrate-binding protein
MILSTDQLGRTIQLDRLPERIISLVPSQTELLADLHLEKEVIGITKFCIHPDPWYRSKSRIGGTKNVDLEKVRSLKPDLIIANKEENERSQIEELASEFPVWTSSVTTIPEALQMIQCISEITGRAQEGQEILKKIEISFKEFHPEPFNADCLYLIWNNPYMAAGNDTFICSILKLIGLNIVPGKDRYPEINKEDIYQLAPRVILLSSEPYPFKEKHLQEIQMLSPNSSVFLVDGEMFSWYGSRMLKIPEYLRNLYDLIKMSL